MIPESENFRSFHLVERGRENVFYNKDILSVREFNPQNLSYLFELTNHMREIVETRGGSNILKGKVLANLFYEPSTRTSSSFMAAMQRLGGNVIPINEVRYSSVMKGESLPDTVRTLERYADVIVIRHPQVGSAQIAADYARKPVINAGDGVGEHPTQALLDLYTIQSELQKIDGLKVALVGDLLNGRTVHSLVLLLSYYDVDFQFVSPSFLSLPKQYKEMLSEKGRRFSEYENLEEVIGQADVVYVTRVQKERFGEQGLTEAQYEEAKRAYGVSLGLLGQAKERMIIMHPLPRVGEIAEEVDNDPRAAYFRQVENGMYVRMALLAAVLGKV